MKKEKVMYYSRVDADYGPYEWNYSTDTSRIPVRVGDIVRFIDKKTPVYGSVFGYEEPAGRKKFRITSINEDGEVDLIGAWQDDLSITALHTEVKVVESTTEPTIKEAVSLEDSYESVIDSIEFELVVALEEVLGKELDKVENVEDVVKLAAETLKFLGQVFVTEKEKRALRREIHKTGVKF